MDKIDEWGGGKPLVNLGKLLLSAVILSALFFGVDVEAGRRSSKRSGSSQRGSSQNSGSRSSKRSGSSQRGGKSSKRFAGGGRSSRSNVSVSKVEQVVENTPVVSTETVSKESFDELKAMIETLSAKMDDVDKKFSDKLSALETKTEELQTSVSSISESKGGSSNVITENSSASGSTASSEAKTVSPDEELLEKVKAAEKTFKWPILLGFGNNKKVQKIKVDEKGTLDIGLYKVTVSGGSGGKSGASYCGGYQLSRFDGGAGEMIKKEFIVTKNGTPYTAVFGSDGADGADGSKGGWNNSKRGQNGADGKQSQFTVDGVIDITARGGRGGIASNPRNTAISRSECSDNGRAGESFQSNSSGYGITLFKANIE